MFNFEPDYRATLDYLYGYVDYSLHRNYRYHPDQFELSRMVEFLTLLGNPQDKYPIIHIAGTKGKGSVSAFCASALQAAGYQVGLFTSPHMVDFVERIQINRQPIPHQAFINLVDGQRSIIESIPLVTFFEITTALAYQYFATQEVDAAVIEVGMGGRLDATNTSHPVVTVITSLSLDHVSILGDTLAKIAREKAGIIKPGVPVVTAPQPEEAMQVLRNVAAERKAPLLEVGRDIRYTRLGFSPEGESARIWPADGSPPADIRISLKGEHQVENAVVAFAALRIFAQAGFDNLDREAVVRGLEATRWAGRFEVLNECPTLVVDCAHNRHSAIRLWRTVNEYYPDRPVTLIFGASEDKDIEGMFEVLLPKMNRVIVVQSLHPRAAESNTLKELAEKYGKNIIETPDVADAVIYAMKEAAEEDLVLVTGSIFVVAGAREAWLRIRESNE